MLLTNPDERFYTRQLERLTGLPVNAVGRELTKLEKAGFLFSKEEGRVKYFWVNKENPIYEDLKNIILKTQALGDHLRNLVAKVSDIKVAFIYGSVAKGEEKATSDIDLMVIGNIDSTKLHSEIKKIEGEIKRTVNYSLMREKEFKSRKTDFIKRILREKKIFLVGNADELRKFV